MPTRGSDSSEGTEERSPRRRTASRTSSPRTRTSRTRRPPSEDTEPADRPAAAADDDFGDGVVAEEKPARRSEARRSASAPEAPAAEARVPSERSASRRERPVEDSGSDAAPESAPETRPRRPRGERPARRERVADARPIESERPPVRGERRRRTSESSVAPAESVSAEPESRPSPAPRPESDERETRSTNPPRQLEFYTTDADFGDDDFSISDTSDEGDDTPREGGDGDRRPRRRRRRRRRGGSGGGTAGSGPDGRTDGRIEGRTDGRVEGRTESRPEGRFEGRVENRPDTRIEGRSEGRFEGRVEGSSDSQRNDGQRSRGRGRGRNRRGSSGGSGGGGRELSGSGPMGGNRDRDRNRNLPRRGRPIQASGEPIEGTFDGVLELHPKGYGFLRDPRKNYAAEDSNPFVSSSLVEKYHLREGVLIRGEVGQGTRHQGPRLLEVELIDGFTPDEYANVKQFDQLTPINPFEQIRLEVGPRPLTMRVMDLLCPIGKGQRALLVAPPRTGKTMLLQDIANSVSFNHPEIHLMVLLIDERPEEVTEMKRLVNGEVIASSLDNEVESHIRISQLIIERGKRLAEEGKDVFILLDSITRLARAFNKWSNSGRTATGGLDIRALDIPKKLFGTARRFDEGGSLTVCGTALIDTGSRMDEAIFQEFKGTGNMEMVLSRDLADRRIWPSIDVTKSGTRREEKILSPDVLEGTTRLRRSLITLSPVEAMEQLTKTMEKFPTNAEFLTKIRNVL